MLFYRARSRDQRRSFIPSLKLLAIILSFGLGCSFALAADTSTSRGNVKQGDEIFHKRCVVCHSKQPGDTTPFGPPNLYAAFHGHPPLTTAQAETIVLNGKDQMPSFKAVLTRPEIKDVIAYLRSK